VTAIEEIASQHSGVKQAYAINAGREVRVIVNASLVNDDESILLAKEIAAEIEQGVQYPGEIKVNVIRESRAVEFAK
ncbi:MAG: ribonuclease Y, partial [Sulfurimonas sp.]